MVLKRNAFPAFARAAEHCADQDICRAENIAQGGRSPVRPRSYGGRLYSDRYGWWRVQGDHRFMYMERVGDLHVALPEIMDSSDGKAFEMIWLAFYSGL